jgi:hypothetical protein
MDLQAKVYLILSLIFVVMILQMAKTRKKAMQKSSFPIMLNAFRADFGALNGLKILYYLKHMQLTFELHPLMMNEIIEFLSPERKKEKFEKHKASSYYILLKVKGDKELANAFASEFGRKFNVAKIETKLDESLEVFILEKFTQLNLSNISVFIVDYLKREHPMILGAPDNEAKDSSPLLQ